MIIPSNSVFVPGLCNRGFPPLLPVLYAMCASRPPSYLITLPSYLLSQLRCLIDLPLSYSSSSSLAVAKTHRSTGPFTVVHIAIRL